LRKPGCRPGDLEYAMELKQKVMSGLRWSTVAKFLGQLVTWGITIVVIRLLTPADYGLIALAGVFVAFLAMLNELGLGAAVIQRKDLSDDDLRSLFGLVLLASAGFYLLLAAAAPLIADFYDEPRLTLLIRVLALQFFLMGFSVLPQSLLNRDMAFRKMALVELVSAVAGSLATLLLALAGHGVWALVWGSLLNRLVSMVGLNLVEPFLRMPRLTLKGMGAILSFGGYVTASRLLWYFYSRADTLIIGKVLGKEILGFYSVGMYLASLPMEKASGILNQVAFPAFSSVQFQAGVAGRHFLKAVRVLSFVVFPVAFGLSSISPELILIFTGEKWQAATVPLQIISLILPFRMISNLTTPVALGLGRPEISFFNTLFASVIMPVGFLCGVYFGMQGVAIAWLLFYPIVFLQNIARICNLMSIRIGSVVRAMALPFATSCGMYAAVSLLPRIKMVNLDLFAMFFAKVVLGILVYSLLALFFNNKTSLEIREIVKS
jgi:teichuronic acid exporter